MARKYFGTDGVRGKANKVITPDLALRVGQAAGLVFRRGEHRNRVVIGKDTRLSGYMIETALVAGFTSVGMDVLLLGPMPTPAVAMLTRSMRADLGVMISASHNAYEDNGIKLFDPDGFKLSDETEHEIEALIDGNLNDRLAASASLGRAKRIVLFDTLIQRLSASEIEAVLAHELGHWFNHQAPVVDGTDWEEDSIARYRECQRYDEV